MESRIDARALRAAALFTGNDPVKPKLGKIFIAEDEYGYEIAATDGVACFVASTRDTRPLERDKCNIVLLDATWFNSFLKARDVTVQIFEKSNDFVELKARDNHGAVAYLTIPCTKDTYPEYRQLFPKELGDGSEWVSPKYLEKISKASKMLNKGVSTPALQIEFTANHKRKPLVFTLARQVDGLLSKVLLMPIRMN